MNRLTAVSGLGGKGPACFLLESAGRRLLLDFGEGPQPGLLPDIDSIGKIDALALSHQHADHLGALRFLGRIGDPPVFASAYVARSVSGPVHALPLQGRAEIAGIAVTTGRSGHAPGGLWLHFAVADGLLYMGDNCDESPLYAADAPPPAATAILDASYGAYDAPLADCEAALDALVARPGRLLLPLPAQGRGPEIALHLLRRGVPTYLDEENRKVVAALLDEPSFVRPPARSDLARLLAASAASPAQAKAILVAPATLKSELAQRLIAERADAADISIVFTGYTPPGTQAGDLLDRGQAEFLRWNIHPRLRDNAALVRAIGARQVLPAFGDADKARAAWERAFAPASVLLDGTCPL
ncbi:MAG: MBL fold metallo-hydrolase [Alphaproteobacteria bacterium]